MIKILTGLCAALALIVATEVPAQTLPAVPIPMAVNLPYAPGTGPGDRDVPFLAWHEDLNEDGYSEQEILMSGAANTYRYVDEAAQTFEVEVASSGRAYTTRALLRHPSNPADFNGVVYLEILNATSRYDGAPMWNLTYPSIIADGAAWVGVTYSDVTARFMRDSWGQSGFPAPDGAQARNRSRYAALNVPNRTLTWDIVSHAAALLKDNANPANPMTGFSVDTIIVTGYSQSARYVNTYLNSFYPLTGVDPNDPIVDGGIIAAGGPTASKLDGLGSHLYDPRSLERGLAKTVRFTTESDIDSVLVRQTMDEKPNLRVYEVAGTSHVDLNGSLVGLRVADYQFGVSGLNDSCDLALNPIRTGIPLSAIQYRLANWIADDSDLPPPSNFIEFTGDFADGSQAWVRDSDGNALGGVRPPRLNVPVGSYSGANTYSGPLPAVAAILCPQIIGSFQSFNESELRNRYGTRMFYVVLTWWAMFASYMDGFLLAVDAPTIMNEAKTFGGFPVE